MIFQENHGEQKFGLLIFSQPTTEVTCHGLSIQEHLILSKTQSDFKINSYFYLNAYTWFRFRHQI
jgi:hypothetical protein